MAEEYHFGHATGETGDMGEVVFKRPNQIAIFYRRSVHMAFKSKQEGRPISEGRDFVKIITPGERDEVDREATEYDKKVFASGWKAYQEGREAEPEGTPLAHLFPNDPDLVDNLRSLKFFTVEQLAGANDSVVQTIAMGGYDFRDKARKFLEGSKDGARFGKLEQALMEMAARLKTLETENEGLKLDAKLREREAERAEAAPKAARR